MVKLVDIGGYRLAIEVAGSGIPPVVCVSGLTGDTAEWQGVGASLRVPTAFVAYGRPALGGSDPLPPSLAQVPRAPSWAAGQLRTLLDRAGVPAPRVLAGHSIGGLVVEAYAALWPQEAAGLVLIDPTDPRANVDIGEPISVSVDAEGGGTRFSTQACLDERRHFPTPTVPAVVVTAAVGSWLRMDPDSIDPTSLAEADQQWQQYQREWAARTNAVQVVAHEAGHCIHIEAPRLVAGAVDAVVRAARTHAPVRLDPVAVGESGGWLVPVAVRT